MTPAPPALVDVARRVETRLVEILDAERRRWRDLDPALDEPLAALSALVTAGGKRIRPAYCHWGWVAAGGDPDDPAPVEAGCALELLHAFALAHDDVMDGSATRRGQPTVHRRFIERHAAEGWRGEARRFGEAVAVLVGDMAMVLADRVLGPVDDPVREVWDELRSELNMGQYLDVLGTARGGVDEEGARTIVAHKTAGYTVVRPLQLGAALAGRPDMSEPLAAHGTPLGVAFQLVDDLLGVFGDPAVTGKPVGEDLREGKPTLLLARARHFADPAQTAVLDGIGPDLDEDGVAAIQQVMLDTGAVAAVEAEVAQLLDRSQAALDGLPDGPARRALAAIADYVVARDT
ncbi:MAG: polyprenyl synthetase family protein [Actinomyces sp.]|nr:MAG: polyprenyl synthetase family protein [Actinomyces sp.]